MFLVFINIIVHISSISPMTKPYRPMQNRLNMAIDNVFIMTPIVEALKASFVLPRACRALESGPSKLYNTKKKERTLIYIVPSFVL